MSDHPELEQWADRLQAAYDIPDAPVDIDRILSLAGEAAHTITRPAAPVTTYIAGFAAGLAAGHQTASEQKAAAAADLVARQLLAEIRDADDAGPDSEAPRGR
ncbi:DUF6457 domain-containing protein [Zhihengliuella sp.]|uniref:DUF6457 domain-containing protein n=1 Tax=Zhihengliuella sp. TaxID=1954483 RepID=UPI002811EC8F|nr:DUF6457 domain-containing protein [Zhihengliuella sp.]